jgi:predicted ATPase
VGSIEERRRWLIDEITLFICRRSKKDEEPLMLTQNLSPADSMLASIADPQRAPEMLAVRETVRGWRFYDGFRTDITSPVRVPQIGTFTPVLGNDGTDLPAALQTIIEIGDAEGLGHAIDDAFPGSRIHIDVQAGRFEVNLRQHGLLRPLCAAELSDGTLRFLLWSAALLTPRPPELMVLNEPETSLHPDLLPALGRLIAAASRRSQLIVVSHAEILINALTSTGRCKRLHLEKAFGETVVPEQTLFTKPKWEWPPR